MVTTPVPLQQFLRVPAAQVTFEHYVDVASRVVSKGWLVLNAVFARLLLSPDAFPNLQKRKNDLTAVQILYECLHIGTRAIVKNHRHVYLPCVQRCWDEDFAAQGWPVIDLPQCMHEVLKYAALTMQTNLVNSCTMHMTGYVRKYLRSWLRAQGIDSCNDVVRAVLNAFLKGFGDAARPVDPLRSSAEIVKRLTAQQVR